MRKHRTLYHRHSMSPDTHQTLMDIHNAGEPGVRRSMVLTVHFLNLYKRELLIHAMAVPKRRRKTRPRSRDGSGGVSLGGTSIATAGAVTVCAAPFSSS